MKRIKNLIIVLATGILVKFAFEDTFLLLVEISGKKNVEIFQNDYP